MKSDKKKFGLIDLNPVECFMSLTISLSIADPWSICVNSARKLSVC